MQMFISAGSVLVVICIPF